MAETPAEVPRRSGGRMLQDVAWFLFLLAGWVVLGYVAFAVTGGWTAAWAWIRGLPLIVQLVMWLLFLPWMLALWIWHLAWPVWLRVLLVGGLVFVTYAMSVPPLMARLKGA